MLLKSILIQLIVNLGIPIFIYLYKKNKFWLFVLSFNFIWSTLIIYELVYTTFYDVDWLLRTPGVALIEFYFVGPFYCWLFISLLLLFIFLCRTINKLAFKAGN
jgi:hypothetical protein